MSVNDELLNRLEDKIYEGTDLKSVNNDIEEAMFTIRDKIIPKLIRNMGKKVDGKTLKHPLAKAADELRRVQGELADISNLIRGKL